MKEKAPLGRVSRLLAPLVFGLLFLAAWEIAVHAYAVPVYILPRPLLIAQTLRTDGPSLLQALWVTLRIAFAALAAAVVLGLALAIVMSRSRWVEASLLPYAVILQVTPIVAIAPLIIIWADNVQVALLICAWIVAFFPILSSTTLGLRAADRKSTRLNSSH